MSHLTIELEAELGDRLDELAASERKSPQELATEAIRRFVAERKRPVTTVDADPYAPLRAMIGLAKGGRSDSSIHHDYRPGDDE